MKEWERVKVQSQPAAVNRLFQSDSVQVGKGLSDVASREGAGTPGRQLPTSSHMRDTR